MWCQNVVPVQFDKLCNTLTVEIVPGGWDEVKHTKNLVLEYCGSHYPPFTGWNSDRNVAYFQRSVEIAHIRQK